MKEYKKPFLGAAYYPEDWDFSEVDYDISKMKEAGISCARIGEFAWSKMEPKPGAYDFSFFRFGIKTKFLAKRERKVEGGAGKKRIASGRMSLFTPISG